MALRRTAACILLAATAPACRTNNCPDIAPPVAPPRPDPPPAPSCTPLTQADAQARATAWLLTRTNSTTLPDDLTARDCTSHCQPPRSTGLGATPCDTWTCPFKYSDRKIWWAYTYIDVYITACDDVFTARPYARCFAKPHGCKLNVRAAEAVELVTRQLGEVHEGDIALRWSARDHEFRWVATASAGDGPWTGLHEVMSISAHAADQITVTPLPPPAD